MLINIVQELYLNISESLKKKFDYIIGKLKVQEEFNNSLYLLSPVPQQFA